MKKILFLLLLFSLVLASCRKGGNEEPNPNPNVPVEPNEPSGPNEPSNPGEPSEPTTPVDPNAPTFSVGYCDPGYSLSLNSNGEFLINKKSSALQWESATIDVLGYTSEYCSFNIKFSTNNVTNFSIELIVLGGESNWAENVTVYQGTVINGEHELFIDFSNIEAVSTETWNSISGCYIKDYEIAGVKIALDTAVDNPSDLVKEEASCTINELMFKVVEIEDEPQNPNPEPSDPAKPEEPDTTNPISFSVGYCDPGYSLSVNSNDEYVVNKYAKAGQWESATINVLGYDSDYSAFTIKLTTSNVSNLSIELLMFGGESYWAQNVTVYQSMVEDGVYELYIDFTEVEVISTLTWDVVPGYYIKDYEIAGIKIALDTAVDNPANLINEDASCIINELKFEKVSNSEEPEEKPEEPIEPEDTCPISLSVGYCDVGYNITNDDVTGEFMITKAESAGQWQVATINVLGYTSNYSAFTLKFTSTNVVNLYIELVVNGGDDSWTTGVGVYNGVISNGEHEITIDFTDVKPIDKNTWQSVEGYYIKDYEIIGIKFALDTAVSNVEDLILEESSCLISKLKFIKVGNESEEQPEEPNIPEQPEEPIGPSVPEIPDDPNAPTTDVGYCDAGYSISKDEITGEYTISKYATAGQWQVATIDVLDYTSKYSTFVIVFTTTNVKNFYIELLVNGGESTWTTNVGVYKTTLKDGKHAVYIDFSEVSPIDKNTWQSIPGYYIKDYEIAGIKIALDTSVSDVGDLVKEDATCVIHQLGFIEKEEIEEPSYEDEVYIPTNTILSFSDENESQINKEATFDISNYTQNAASYIKTYQLFGSGMCLQRDAINRIWGTATNTNYIAIEFKGEVYYGTVESGNFEVYLPKMNAGGPYTLTIISEAGRVKLTNVYVGEVFVLSGQSNMEWQPQHSEGILAELYSTSACINDQIRMYKVGWNTPTEPSTSAIQYSQWKGANQDTIYTFTAVGYIFGKKMQEELGCPVGLIANPVGGSSIEFWLSEENYNKVQDIYTSYTTSDTYMTPSLGYNGMLYPLTGLNVRGVVWYQGESNAFGTQEYYDKALEIYIAQCREMFNNDNLSFTICELARYESNPLAYSIVNEKINEVATKDPYVVVARNLDLGDWYDIHPKDKREIGKRAALETLRVFFKKDIETPITVSGYTFNDDGSVTINLSKDANLLNGTNGFEVYVNGKYTYDCNVTISGNTLTITANGDITMVRYGYTCKMTSEIKNDVSKMVTVYGKDGLPLDLFIISK